MRSISGEVILNWQATLRHCETARPTSLAVFLALGRASPNSAATERASSREAVLSSRVMLVVKIRGLMRTDVGFIISCT